MGLATASVVATDLVSANTVQAKKKDCFIHYYPLIIIIVIIIIIIVIAIIL